MVKKRLGGILDGELLPFFLVNFLYFWRRTTWEMFVCFREYYMFLILEKRSMNRRWIMEQSFPVVDKLVYPGDHPLVVQGFLVLFFSGKVSVCWNRRWAPLGVFSSGGPVKDMQFLFPSTDLEMNNLCLLNKNPHT